MLQAPIFDGLSFCPFALLDDGLRPAEVGIGRCDVVQALVIALMVVMLDSICPGEVDASTLSSLRKRRSTLTGLMFMAEREWRGPPRVWGLVRRNGGWIERLDLFSKHYAGALRWRYEALRANL